MTYLTKQQIKTIVSNAPKGTNPKDIVAGLLAKGHTLEGYGNAEQVATLPPKRDFLQTASDAVNKVFPGKQVGQAIGTLAGYGISKLQGTSKYYDTSAPTPLQVGGDILQGASLVGGLKLPGSSSILKTAGQYAGLSGATALGSGLSNQKSIKDMATETAKAALIGGAVGGVFGLLGKGISAFAKKSGPTALSFTSGVPKKAIDKAIESPIATKVGRMTESATSLQQKAVDALNHPTTGLYRALSDEFSSGLDTVTAKYGYGGKMGNVPQPSLIKYPGGGVNLPAFNKASKIALAGNKVGDGAKIANQTKSLINEFRLTSKNGVIDFSKSSIVKKAEQANIQEAFDTVKNWSDYTPKGLQTLAERIGELRNFDTPAGTKQSAILGKVYNKLAGNGGIIQSKYPDLFTLRENFAKNVTVLNEINSVIGGSAKTPQARTAAINRLSTLFREDKDLYINAVKQLSDRSGTDILGLLAGTEFQKVLPGFVRGLGGGGALAVGSAFVNPWLWILAPLFSPRGVGTIVGAAPSISRTASAVSRGISSQVVGNSQQ